MKRGVLLILFNLAAAPRALRGHAEQAQRWALDVEAAISLTKQTPSTEKVLSPRGWQRQLESRFVYALVAAGIIILVGGLHFGATPRLLFRFCSVCMGGGWTYILRCKK